MSKKLTAKQNWEQLAPEHVRLQKLSHLAQLRVEIAFIGEQLRTMAMVTSSMQVREKEAYHDRYGDLLRDYRVVMGNEWFVGKSTDLC